MHNAVFTVSAWLLLGSVYTTRRRRRCRGWRPTSPDGAGGQWVSNPLANSIRWRHRCVNASIGNNATRFEARQICRAVQCRVNDALI